MAEERYNRKVGAEQEFQSKIKNAVSRRSHLKTSMEKKATVLHALRIRKIINEVIHNFYKPPKKYDREAAGYDGGASVSVGGNPNKSTTIASGAQNQSQMTSGTSGKGDKKGKKGAEEVEVPKGPIKPVFDYGDDKFNAVAEEIWDAREKLN